MKNLIIILSLLLSGCASISDVNNGLRRVDAVWMSDYESTQYQYRWRIIDNQSDEIFDHIKQTFIQSGFAVRNLSKLDGSIQADANAKSLLTEEKWAIVKAQDELKMKSVGGSSMYIDASTYNINAIAQFKKFNGKSYVGIDVKIRSPYLESKGIFGSQFPPPTASRLFSSDFWYRLDGLLSSNGLPRSRQGKDIEFSELRSGVLVNISNDLAKLKDSPAEETKKLLTQAEEQKRIQIQLAEQRERERITAELDLERNKRQELQTQLATTAQPNSSQTNAPRRIAHALVIGNGAYPGSGRLDNPVNDANAISQKLRSMGFIVTTVTDANRQKLVQSMAQFRRTAASADISLLYYAGHGVQIFGTNYILPTDVDQTDPAQATIQGVSLNSVVENFLPGKTKLVFLDACRDNALQRTNDRSVSKGLAPISAAEGTLISYATKDGQTAADGVGSKNSPFTQALLEHLNDPQDIAVVLRKVRERVMKITGGKQQPWEYGSLTGGELVLSAIKPK